MLTYLNHQNIPWSCGKAYENIFYSRQRKKKEAEEEAFGVTINMLHGTLTCHAGIPGFKSQLLLAGDGSRGSIPVTPVRDLHRILASW